MDFAVKRQMDIESDGVKFRLAIQQSESMREMWERGRERETLGIHIQSNCYQLFGFFPTRSDISMHTHIGFWCANKR